MTQEFDNALAELFRETPSAPAPDADLDVDALVRAVTAMVEAREPLVATLRQLAAQNRDSSQQQDVIDAVADIRARDARWSGLLACRRHAIAERLGALGRAKRQAYCF